MRSTRSCALVVVLLSACSRPNPAFDGGEGEGEGEGEGAQEGEPTAGRGTTLDVTSVDGGEGSETPASTAADTTSGMSGPGTSGTESGSGMEGPLETSSACERDFASDYTLVTGPALEEVLGGCPAGANYLHIQRVDVRGDMVTGNICGPECPCAEAPITMTFDLTLPELPACFTLRFRVDPACKVLEYEILADADPFFPVFMASNASKFVGGLSFYFPPDPIEDCEGGCVPSQSGHYILRQTTTNMPVPPDGTPTLLPGPPADYMVVNDRSGVDNDCLEVVHWYATRGPF
jgi:hypothetical protein